jgi:predicted sulfurtransferase
MEDKETQKRKRRLSKRERKRIQKARTTESNVTYSDGSIVVQESLLPTDYLDSYVPIPVPTVPSAIASSQKSNSTSKTEDLEDTQVDEGGCKSLGKWFPSAIVIKCSVCYTNTGLLITHGTNKVPETPIDTKKTPPKASLVLFYQYTTEVYPTLWSHHQLKLFITYLSTIAKERNLGGRMRVAPEGINATVSAVDLDSSSQSAAATLRHFAQDLKQFDPVLFGKTHFKFMDELSADRHFKECKILPVQELVYYGIREEDAPLSSNSGDLSVIATNVGGGGIHLEPQKYHEMLQKDNTVVIDVRNHYETVLGRFDGQTLKDVHGAEYVDPCMRKSTDFTSWLAKDETKELLQGKQVLMYCTGE